MSRADLLLLDEPTSGLDPLMERAFRECVDEARERGQTVFLSSHILARWRRSATGSRSSGPGGWSRRGDPRRDARTCRRCRWRRSSTGAAPDLRDVAGVSAVQVDGNRIRCQVTGSIEPMLRGPRRRGRAAPDQPGAVARGAVPGALRRGRRGGGGGGPPVRRRDVYDERRAARVVAATTARRASSRARCGGSCSGGRSPRRRPRTHRCSPRRPRGPRSRVRFRETRPGQRCSGRSAGSTRWPVTPSTSRG